MKNVKHLLYFVLVATTFAFTADTKKFKLDNSLLWKIEGKGIQTSYLFGTIHLMPEDQFVFHEKTKTAMETCDALMLELDITAPNMQVEMMKYAMLPDGKKLSDYLSTADYATLDSALLATSGMGLQALNTFKPFVIESFFMQNMIGNKTASYEIVLADIAKETENPILSLETMEEQMTMFDEVSIDEQLVDLMNYARGDEDLKKLFDELVTLYLAEDLNQLDQYMAGYFPDEKWLEYLLYRRNSAWIPKIKAETAKQSIFIAVGAGHLGGEKGVINLLRKEGLKVTAVK